jgi:hypothetical protein
MAQAPEYKEYIPGRTQDKGRRRKKKKRRRKIGRKEKEKQQGIQEGK